MRDIIIKWATVAWFIWFQISPFSWDASSPQRVLKVSMRLPGGSSKTWYPCSPENEQTKLDWNGTNFTIWIMFWTSRPIATWMPGASPRHLTSWKWSSESIWNKPQAIGDWPVIGGRYLLHRVHRLRNLGESIGPTAHGLMSASNTVMAIQSHGMPDAEV